MPRSESSAGGRGDPALSGAQHEAGASRASSAVRRPRAAALHPALVLSSVLVLFLVTSCSFDYESVNAAPDEEAPSAVFRDFRHTVYMGGAKALSLSAGLAESYDRDGRIVLHDVSFSSYSRGTGELAAEGRAETAVFHSDTQNADFSGSITIRSSLEDASLEAEYLEWKGAEKTLSGGLDRSVSVKRGDGSWLRGAGFIADSRRRSFSFREAVEGAFVAPEGGDVAGASGTDAPGSASTEGGSR